MKSQIGLVLSLAFAATLQACGGNDDGPAVATPADPILVKSLACSEISTASLGLQGASVTTSEVVASGSFTPPGSTNAISNLPNFCRIAATLKPTAESDIKIEVWMPANWNGKYVAVGNGGLAGSISYNDMAPNLRAGYATASTDTGHTSTDTTWLPSYLKQYEYMSGSVHEMTVTAKNLLQKHYGKPQTRAYYQGCSTGGGQGFSQVQRYPQDYDGVIAGAPQNFPTHFRAALVYDWQIANSSAATVLPTATMANVTREVVRQCGGSAAATDGFLMNPQACSFDPAVMQCAAGQSGSTCLTSEQVGVVRAIYAGLKAPGSGVQMWPGFSYGSESGWSQHGTAGGNPFGTSTQFFRLAVLQQPNFDLKQMDFGPTVQKADQLFADAINSINTDISPFTSRGGKLLMYHGWHDPLIAPQNTINYYESVVDTVGSRQRTESSVRLFMVPGMGHCSGGPGASNFDTVAALDAWIEKGEAPARIVATSTTTPAFTRPLCPYPQVAEYSGGGDRTQAASWQCVGRVPVADREFYRRGLNVF